MRILEDPDDPQNSEANAKAQPESIRSLFEAEERRLLHYANGYVKRRAVAEELVQEAFLRLHRNWESVEKPRAWIYRCVRNLALNHLRDHKREAPMPEHADEPGSDRAPDEALHLREALGLVREFIAELKEDDQELIRLKYHEDLSYKKISEAMGIGVGNVGYRLHHVLKDLSEALLRVGVSRSSLE